MATGCMSGESLSPKQQIFRSIILSMLSLQERTFQKRMVATLALVGYITFHMHLDVEL